MSGSGHLRLVPDPPEVAPPALDEYEGWPVVWAPWQPPVWSTLQFHADLSCERCGADTGAWPRAVGATERPGRRVEELAASRCPRCGWVFVTAPADPEWWWMSAADGELDLEVSGRTVEPSEPAQPVQLPAPVPAPRPPVAPLPLPVAPRRAGPMMALRARCPHCKASPWMPCTRPRRGARVECDPHPSRVDAATADLQELHP